MIEVLLAIVLVQEPDAAALVARVEEKALTAETLHVKSACVETAKRGNAEFTAEAWFKGGKARYVLEGKIEGTPYRLVIACDGATVVLDGGRDGEERVDAPKDFVAGFRMLLVRGGAVAAAMLVSRKSADPGILAAGTWKAEPDGTVDGKPAKAAAYEHTLAGTKVTGTFWWDAGTLAPLARTLSMTGSTAVTEERVAVFDLDGAIGDDVFTLPAERPATKLRALMTKLQQAVATGDAKTAAAITKGLIGDEKRLRLGLRSDVKADDVEKIVAWQKKMVERAGDDAKWAAAIAMGPKQTQVSVHEATTEEIDAYREGTTAFQHFPGGAKRLASRLLREKTTYFEVEFKEPGQRFGISYHLFYWDGEAWTMLGSVWRAFREK